MKTMIRSLAAGAFGLALVCGVIGPMAGTTASAGTVPVEEVAIDSMTTPCGRYDADFTASPSTVSQKAQRQFQQLQFRMQVMKMQMRLRGMAHAMTASEAAPDVSVSAFDPESATPAGAGSLQIKRPVRKISIYFNPPER